MSLDPDSARDIGRYSRDARWPGLAGAAARLGAPGPPSLATWTAERNVSDRADLGESPVPMRQGPIRLLVVDDHEIVRHGLVTLLERRQQFQVVAQAGTHRAQAPAFVARHRMELGSRDLPERAIRA